MHREHKGGSEKAEVRSLRSRQVQSADEVYFPTAPPPGVPENGVRFLSQRLHDAQPILWLRPTCRLAAAASSHACSKRARNQGSRPSVPTTENKAAPARRSSVEPAVRWEAPANHGDRQPVDTKW